MEAAKNLRGCYYPSCEFPDWVINPIIWETFKFDETLVFYDTRDNFDDIRLMVEEREPVNMTMKRFYDKDKLFNFFRYQEGAYRKSTPDKLMPNIAIYCHATVHVKSKLKLVHVINLVGYAFDHLNQPDLIYFKDRPREELIQKYSDMWMYLFMCATRLKLKKVHIYNVGGGSFSGVLMSEKDFIKNIFEPSFLELSHRFPDITVLGFNKNTKQFDGGRIPDILSEPSQDLEGTLYVNAWDPWSIIGNGNGRDGSLDGYWGRSSNMSVLGWSKTNNKLKYVGIKFT